MASNKHLWDLGDTPQSVAKKYGIAWEDIWNYGDNFGLKNTFKKPANIPPGEHFIWLPDKKVLAAQKELARPFVMKWKGEQICMTKGQWIDLQRKVEKEIEGGILRSLTSMYEDAMYYRESARKLTRESPLITVISETLGGAEMPSDALMEKAMTHVVRAKVDVESWAWKGVEKNLSGAIKSVPAFYKAMCTYRADLEKGAERSITGLRIVKATSFTIFGALAATVCAPVGATYAEAAIAAGKSGLLTGFLSTTSSEVGSGMSEPNFKLGEASKKVVLGTLEGGVLGLITGPLSKGVSKGIANGITSRTLKSLAGKEPMISRLGVGAVKTLTLDYLKTSAGKKDLAAAATKVSRSITGKEDEKELTKKTVAQLVKMGVIQKAVKKQGKRAMSGAK